MAAQTVADRLSEYIGDEDGKRMSIRAFAEAMKSREPRPKGSTRAMIHRYLEAGPEGPVPSLDFIEAAADQLGLAPGWLAFGTDEPTRAEEVGAIAQQEAEAERNALRAEIRQEMAERGLTLAEQVRAESAVLFRGDTSGAVWRSYMEALRDLVAASPPNQNLTKDEILDLAAALTSNVLATYASLHLGNAYPRPEAGFSARRRLPVRGSWRFAAFAMGFLQTVRGTLPAGRVAPGDLLELEANRDDEGGDDGEA